MLSQLLEKERKRADIGRRHCIRFDYCIMYLLWYGLIHSCRNNTIYVYVHFSIFLSITLHVCRYIHKLNCTTYSVPHSVQYFMINFSEFFQLSYFAPIFSNRGLLSTDPGIDIWFCPILAWFLPQLLSVPPYIYGLRMYKIVHIP